MLEKKNGLVIMQRLFKLSSIKYDAYNRIIMLKILALKWLTKTHCCCNYWRRLYVNLIRWYLNTKDKRAWLHDLERIIKVVLNLGAKLHVFKKSSLIVFTFFSSCKY